jgi:hypothetical protein
MSEPEEEQHDYVPADGKVYELMQRGGILDLPKAHRHCCPKAILSICERVYPAR